MSNSAIIPRYIWSDLDPDMRRMLLARPPRSGGAELSKQVAAIIEQVREQGDQCLGELTLRYDGVALSELEVSASEWAAAEGHLDSELKAAIAGSRERITRFHQTTAAQPVAVETAPGLICEKLPVPIQRVGLYVPAGSAPLPSTALMLAIPARLADCPEVILCTPPGKDGRADPAVLYAARLCGVRRAYTVGGAQAIAAMAYGTETIPACDKLFGPGNGWVDEAKRQVSLDPEGAAIDLPAGPSEVLVIADAQANPEFVAADLLAQAEHGPDSQVLLVSDSAELLDAVETALAEQLAQLPRAAVASTALQHSRAVLVETIDEALQLCNDYAPEHLILQLRQPRRWLPRVSNAGSVFLGDLTPESLGDYGSGTNHVLPTGGAARFTGGVCVDSFRKLITVQQADSQGLREIGAQIVRLADAEGLQAHAQAVSRRLSWLDAQGEGSRRGRGNAQRQRIAVGPLPWR